MGKAARVPVGKASAVAVARSASRGAPLAKPEAGLAAPEAQLGTAPYMIGFLNVMASLTKVGLTMVGAKPAPPPCKSNIDFGPQKLDLNKEVAMTS